MVHETLLQDLIDAARSLVKRIQDADDLHAVFTIKDSAEMQSLMAMLSGETVSCNYCGSKCIDRERFPMKDFCNECERTVEALRCRSCQNTGVGLSGDDCKCGCTTYRDLLEHTLGMNGVPGFRNFFDADKTHDDYETLCQMVKAGYMRRGKDTLFHATEKGATFIKLGAAGMVRAGIKPRSREKQ